MLLGIVWVGVLIVEPTTVVVDEEPIVELIVHAVCGIVVRSLEYSRRHTVLLSYRRKAAQPVLVMQCVDVLLWVCRFLGRWRAIEVGYLAVKRSHHFVCRKWQADAFPCAFAVLGIVQWPAHIPCAVVDVEGDGHAEIVVVASLSISVLVVGSALHEV